MLLCYRLHVDHSLSPPPPPAPSTRPMLCSVRLERGRREQACAECRTQPIVRVYTFGERSTSKQKKMQQRQDMGEGQVVDHWVTPTMARSRSSCCAASQSYRRPGTGTVVFAERDRERLCRREQNVCRAIPVLAVCAEQPPAARAARHARQPGSLPHALWPRHIGAVLFY